MISIERTQFPVGQGGFHYGEINFENGYKYTWIFDCGTLNSQKLIDSYLHKIEEEIDVFYLSHFHYDHYSGLNQLLYNGIKIKKFVIPYTDIADRFIYALTDPAFTSGGASASTYIDFLVSPKQYLSINFDIPEESIIEVDADSINSEETINLENPGSEYSVRFNYKNGSMYISGNRFNNIFTNIWEIKTYLSKYIPVQSQFFSELLSFFKKEKLVSRSSGITAKDLEKIFNQEIFWKYVFYKSSLHKSKIKKLDYKLLKNFYKDFCKKHKIDDGVNGCSISLYSGSSHSSSADLDISIKKPQKLYYRLYKHFFFNEQLSFWEGFDGWIHPGDDSLSKSRRLNELCTFYSPANRVTIFSAPHHGSDRSWNKDILSKFSNTIFLLSHSKPGHRGWRHPGNKVIIDCSNSRVILHSITDQPLSEFSVLTIIH